MSDIKSENIYYLGPDGSNAHFAMQNFLIAGNIEVQNKIPCKSIRQALEALENDVNSLCVLPIENSIEGIVRETIDNLLKRRDKNIQILAEYTLPIKHMLLSKGTDKTKIKKIISHPQALAQCSNHIYELLPDAELKEVSSTSYAAQKISEENDTTLAAIANETCAKLFNLNILETDLNDETDNKTRFYLLGRHELKNIDNGKTAMVLSTKNKSGALCEALKIIAKHNFNLTYIDSRPSKKKLGEYLFFMELEGVISNKRTRNVLEELSHNADFVSVLGSFKIFN